MFKKQDGYIDGVDLVRRSIAVVAVVFLIWICTYSTIVSNRLDKWEGECRSQNGQVVKVSDNRYECYVDGKKVVLKGYEQYQ